MKTAIAAPGTAGTQLRLRLLGPFSVVVGGAPVRIGGRLLSRDPDRAGQHFQAGLAANPNDDLLQVEYGRI